MTTHEVGIEEARAKLGDLVRDAQQHGITTYISRNGRRAAIIAPDPDGGEPEQITAMPGTFVRTVGDVQVAAHAGSVVFADGDVPGHPEHSEHSFVHAQAGSIVKVYPGAAVMVSTDTLGTVYRVQGDQLTPRTTETTGETP